MDYLGAGGLKLGFAESLEAPQAPKLKLDEGSEEKVPTKVEMA